MVPESMPFAIQANVITLYLIFHHGIGDWKESEVKLIEVTKKILETFKNIWCNPAFHPEFVESLNERTYVNNVVVPLINAALYNNPFGESAFITTIASADRRGDGRMGRKPDIMFVTKDNDKFYELMYSECSRIVCTDQKEEDDYVKLWREVNDGMFWAHKSRRLEKEQFGIIGIQVTGCTLRLNALIRDEIEVHRYYKLRE
ncbi:676_t:CDS:2 [Gigaspora margarita]|uniref:676_t:CDS:1 n=1 Tax=Gigaspora margarita TaxID=4874 RepID=A0ABN7UMN4_GIGMA|nr:676_t:CDS:2 [Gigaspora margarita]